MTDSATVIHNARKVVDTIGDTSPRELADACVMLLLFAYDRGIDSKLMTFEQFAEEVQLNLVENRKKQKEQGGNGLFVGIAEGSEVEAMTLGDLNPWEKACREFLKGCINALPAHPENCPECLSGFLEHLQAVKKSATY